MSKSLLTANAQIVVPKNKFVHTAKAWNKSRSKVEISEFEGSYDQMVGGNSARVTPTVERPQTISVYLDSAQSMAMRLNKSNLQSLEVNLMPNQ